MEEGVVVLDACEVDGVHQRQGGDIRLLKTDMNYSGSFTSSNATSIIKTYVVKVKIN